MSKLLAYLVYKDLSNDGNNGMVGILMLIQRGVENTGKKSRSARLKRTGTIIMAVVTLVTFMLIMAPNFIFSRWIYGIFGVYVFSIKLLVFFAGLAIRNSRKYSVNRRYILTSCIMLFAVFTAIHLAVTSEQLAGLYFGDYLAHGFSNITPGGIIFAMPSFLLHSVLYLEGSLVVLGVLFVISAAVFATHIVAAVGENKVINRKTTIAPETYSSPGLSPKTKKEMEEALESKYQELLTKQSRKTLDLQKSQLGLVQPPAREVAKNNVAEVAQVIPSASAEITQWSTEAAAKLESGIKAPLFSGMPNSPFAKKPNPQPTTDYSWGSPQPSQPSLSPYQTQPLPSWDMPAIAPPQPQPIFPTFTPQPALVTPQPQPISNSWSTQPEENLLMANDRGHHQLSLDTSKVENKVKPYKRSKYIKPTLDLIRTESTSSEDAHLEAIQKQHTLDSKFREFGVNAKVVGFTVAPAVTRFEVQLATGTRVQHVVALEQDIAYALGCPYLRIETTIDGKNAIGFEVPNKSVGKGSIKDILASREFMQHSSPLACVIGKNIADEMVVGDICTMPHLLIAGSTGSGKSVCLNTLLVSLLFRTHPDDMKLLLVDMKRVELTLYNDIPHMLIPKAIKDVTHAINAFKWLQEEMQRRYDILEANGVNNIGLYHSLPGYQGGTLERMPYILTVIDEAADLMTRGKKEVEDAIKSLSALARACGIHIVLATQRPSVDVITGVIKTNFPVRIAFKVGSRGDSQTIINETGAEKLVGRGDMLFIKEGFGQRVQGAFIENDEARRVMNFIRDNNKAEFDIDLEDRILNGPPPEGSSGGGIIGNGLADAQKDELFIPILRWIVRDDNFNRTVSTSSLQRNFSIGFSRAGKILDQFAAMNFVSSNMGQKARDVIITRDEVERVYGA